MARKLPFDQVRSIASAATGSSADKADTRDCTYLSGSRGHRALSREGNVQCLDPGTVPSIGGDADAGESEGCCPVRDHARRLELPSVNPG